MGLFVEIEFHGGMAVSNSEQHIGFVAPYDFRIFDAQFREHILDVQRELKVGVQLGCFAVRAMHRPHRPPRQGNPARSAIEHLQIVTFRKMADQSPLVWGLYENFYGRGFAVEPYSSSLMAGRPPDALFPLRPESAKVPRRGGAAPPRFFLGRRSGIRAPYHNRPCSGGDQNTISQYPGKRRTKVDSDEIPVRTPALAVPA